MECRRQFGQITDRKGEGKICHELIGKESKWFRNSSADQSVAAARREEHDIKIPDGG